MVKAARQKETLMARKARRDNNGDNKKHHKETFDKIAEKKRARILKIATAEFADKGFRGANINVIAKKANISIGSMYNYFSTKENLFLTVADEAYNHLERALASADLGAGNIFDRIESILRLAQRFSRENPKLIQLYQDITSEHLAHLSRKLSRKLEEISVQFYRRQIQLAKEAGLVTPDLDDFVTTFCIDNIIMLMQFSYTSDYFMERLKAHVGDDALDDDERVIKGMAKFIRRALEQR